MPIANLIEIKACEKSSCSSMPRRSNQHIGLGDVHLAWGYRAEAARQTCSRLSPAPVTMAVTAAAGSILRAAAASSAAESSRIPSRTLKAMRRMAPLQFFSIASTAVSSSTLSCRPRCSGACLQAAHSGQSAISSAKSIA